VAPSATIENIVSATDRRALEEATTGSYLDLTPPTDARPFFFNQLRFATLFDADIFSHFTHSGVFTGNLVATLTLAMLVLVSVALVGATIIVPLRPTVREAGWQLALGGTAYFALLGVGFMMVEIALLQRMSVFLGHPVYALSVVLFSLILWTGFGSMASERVRLAGAGKLVAWSVASAAYLFALPSWLPPLLVDLDGADLFVRAGFCVLVLAPAGFLMGFGFPTGMRLVSAISTGPTPWFWGINGAPGVLAASVAVVTSISFSTAPKPSRRGSLARPGQKREARLRTPPNDDLTDIPRSISPNRGRASGTNDARTPADLGDSASPSRSAGCHSQSSPCSGVPGTQGGRYQLRNPVPEGKLLVPRRPLYRHRQSYR
jgi:hypothetical protein